VSTKDDGHQRDDVWQPRDAVPVRFPVWSSPLSCKLTFVPRLRIFDVGGQRSERKKWCAQSASIAFAAARADSNSPQDPLL